MTEPFPVIRRAVRCDLEALVGLLQELFSIEEDFQCDEIRQRTGLTEMLRDDGHCCVLVAEQDGCVIGMCTMQVLISTAEGGPVGLIEDMVVAQKFRRQGIGRKLLAAMETMACKQGLTRLQLLADRNNDSALDFYRKVGWKSTQLICLRKT